MSKKIDFKKELKNLYNPTLKGFHLVDVHKMNFLMIDGVGNPNTSELYQQAVEALYALAYGIKFAVKSPEVDYVVPPLEGLWWMESMEDFTAANKDRWEWTMMIMQPGWVTQNWVDTVSDKVNRKKRLPMLSKIRFMPYAEGLSVQILYTGAYQDEAPTIAEMHTYIKDNGYRMSGKHHEIYLGDPRKVAPDRLQTILRQPIQVDPSTKK